MYKSYNNCLKMRGKQRMNHLKSQNNFLFYNRYSHTSETNGTFEYLAISVENFCSSFIMAMTEEGYNLDK
jgi:hypothetical protein